MPPRAHASLAAYVLHRYDWSESSLILDLFTREQGRIARRREGREAAVLAAARRAAAVPAPRRSRSAESPGEEAPEVHTLRARRLGRRPADAGRRRAVQRLLSQRAADEAARAPRSARRAVRRLRRHDRRASAAADDARTQAALRAFELVLLREIGLLPDLGTETASHGRCAPSGATSCSPMPAWSRPTATTRRRSAARRCSALRRRSRRRPCLAAAGRRRALAALRPLLRAQLHYHLGTSQLRTRQVMIEAQALEPMNPLVTTGQRPALRRHRALGQRQQDRAAAQPARSSRSRASSACRGSPLEAGAHGITVHPRPDERHIRAGDVHELAALLKEWPRGRVQHRRQPAPEPDAAPARAAPASVHVRARQTRRRRPPTTAGTSAATASASRRWSPRRRRSAIRVSLFMDAEPAAMARAQAIGADRVELYTEPYAQRVRHAGAAAGARRLPRRGRRGAAPRPRRQCRPRPATSTTSGRSSPACPACSRSRSATPSSPTRSSSAWPRRCAPIGARSTAPAQR